MIPIHISKKLLLDYKEPPDELLWRLQRIADFFPAYGTDRETVRLLFEHRDKLKLEKGKYNLGILFATVVPCMNSTISQKPMTRK